MPVNKKKSILVNAEDTKEQTACKTTSDDCTKYIKARIRGKGLRIQTAIWVNNKFIPWKRVQSLNPRALIPLIDSQIQSNPMGEVVAPVDTNEYFLYFEKPPDTEKSWPIRFRRETIKGFEADEFTHKTPNDGEYIVGEPGRESLTVKLLKGVFIKEESGLQLPVEVITKAGSKATAVVTIGAPPAAQEAKAKGKKSKWPKP